MRHLGQQVLWASTMLFGLWLWPGAASAEARVEYGSVAGGVRFLLVAQAVRIPGGWGLDLTVVARSADGRAHGIDRAPLEIIGRPGRRSANTVFSELRRHLGPGWGLTLRPGEKLIFSRRYTDFAKTSPVAPGQELIMTVRVVSVEGAGGTVESPTIAIVRIDVSDEGAPLVGCVALAPP
jgi:hypothetical protein